MVAEVGRAVIVEVDGNSVEDELRSKNITFAGDPTEQTTAGDDGWVTYIDGVHNTRQWTIELEGVEKTGIFAAMRESGEKEECEITVGDKFTLEGDFRCIAYNAAAPHDGEMTFTATLASDGEVTKAPVTP